MGKKIQQDKERVLEDKKHIREARRRLLIIVGKLESAEKLSNEEKSAMYNEFYSARQALVAEAKLLKKDLIQEVLDALDAGDIPTAKAAALELKKILSSKDSDL